MGSILEDRSQNGLKDGTKLSLQILSHFQVVNVPAAQTEKLAPMIIQANAPPAAATSAPPIGFPVNFANATDKYAVLLSRQFRSRDLSALLDSP